MIDWKTKRIGLVLSGGGAKGAYQVGMFRALEQLGLAGRIRVMAGTSIGAFDEVLYAVGGVDAVRSFFTDFGVAADISGTGSMAQAMADVEAGRVSKRAFCTDPRYRRLDSAPFAEVMQRVLPDAVLSALPIRLRVCAYSLEAEKPEYFTLNELPPADQRSLILASGSLPYVFSPVAYRGCHYLDGGVLPPVCPHGAPEDKIPLGALRREDVDAVLVNFLRAEDTVDRALAPADAAYLELRPSAPLEDRPGSGTLDFSPEKLASHEEMGYRDTLALFL
jgi:NTE family protein